MKSQEKDVGGVRSGGAGEASQRTRPSRRGLGARAGEDARRLSLPSNQLLWLRGEESAGEELQGGLGLSVSDEAKLVVIACTTGSYFLGERASSLVADPRHIRAWEGGVGRYKMGW